MEENVPESAPSQQDARMPSERPRSAASAAREALMTELAAEQFEQRHAETPIPVKPLSYRVIKRAFDIVISAVAIAVCAIPSVFLCIAVARDTGGTPFFRQTRLGKGGKPFNIVKFRTMVADANHIGKYLDPDQVDEWVFERKVADDPRVTKLGAFLRRTSIDEIPNFLNAFMGQMSIVGPRAITPKELVWYGDDADLLLSVPAGITGLWQVQSRHEARYQTGERQALELEYVRNASFGLDVKLFFRTFAAVVSHKGV